MAKRFATAGSPFFKKKGLGNKVTLTTTVGMTLLPCLKNFNTKGAKKFRKAVKVIKYAGQLDALLWQISI